MYTACNLSDRSTYFASDSLVKEAKAKNSDCYINIAYTNYGGSFVDKCIIKFFKENYPNNIVVEPTSWNGKNAFIFGDIAKEFLASGENQFYYEGFDDFYYSEKYNEIVKESHYFLENVLKTNLDCYNALTEKVSNDTIINTLIDIFEEQCNVLTNGVDYSEGQVISSLLNILL